MRPEDTPAGKAAFETVDQCMALARTLAKAMEGEAEARSEDWNEFHSYQLVAEKIAALLETAHEHVVSAAANSEVAS